MVALVPVANADLAYSDPGSFQQTLAKFACKQRGVQTLAFECTVNFADRAAIACSYARAGSESIQPQESRN